jgi:hypothetical protein
VLFYFLKKYPKIFHENFWPGVIEWKNTQKRSKLHDDACDGQDGGAF